MKAKEFFGLQIFELLYLLLLAFLPFLLLEKTVSLFVLAAIALWVGFYAIKKWTSKAIEVYGQTVLITGCDSGFGNALARRLDSVGFTVFATVLSTESDGALRLLHARSDRMHIIELDISNEESIAKCLVEVEQHCGSQGLWALVNNAAINFIGDVELTSMELFRKVSDVNLFGTINVTKRFLPLIRRSQGRVVIISSAQGRLAVPSNAAYAITKYGLECFADILRLEVQGFGVKVVIVEPGNFGGSTGMLSPESLSRMQTSFEDMWSDCGDDVRVAYGKQYLDAQYQSVVGAAGTACASIVGVVDAMEEAVSSVSPSVRYLVDGSKSWFDYSNVLIRLRPFLPDRCLDYLVNRAFVNIRLKPAQAVFM